MADPTPKRNGLKTGVRATFFFHSKYFVSGLGWVLHRKQTTRNLTQPKFSANTLFVTVVNVCALLRGFKWYDKALFRWGYIKTYIGNRPQET